MKMRGNTGREAVCQRCPPPATADSRGCEGWQGAMLGHVTLHLTQNTVYAKSMPRIQYPITDSATVELEMIVLGHVPRSHIPAQYPHLSVPKHGFMSMRCLNAEY
jgi:hypothetical protein